MRLQPGGQASKQPQDSCASRGGELRCPSLRLPASDVSAAFHYFQPELQFYLSYFSALPLSSFFLSHSKRKLLFPICFMLHSFIPPVPTGLASRRLCQHLNIEGKKIVLKFGGP